MSAPAREPVVEKVAVREPVAPAGANASSASALAIVGPPAWLTRVVIVAGAVHVPALDDSAPTAMSSSSFAFVVVTEGATTDWPLTVVPFDDTSIGFVGFTP